MTSYFHRAPPLVHSESLMMTDDDLSELEVGPGGSRVYRPRSQTNSMSQGLMSNSAYSMYGSHFGGSNLGNRGYAKSNFDNQSVRSHRDEYARNYFDSQSVQNYRNEYARSHFDNRSVQSHRGFSPESFRSMRLPSEEITIRKADIENLIRVEVDRRLPQEVDRRLQHILHEQSRRPVRKRRRCDLDGRQRDSEENTDDEADRYSTYSTKSEYAMRYVKRSKREMRHPYARSERTSLHGEPITSHRRFNHSQMARSFSQRSLTNMTLQPQSLRPPSVMREINLRNLNCTVITEDRATDEDALTTKSQVGKENLTEKSTENKKGEILKKDHVFVKPSTLPCPKKTLPTFNAPPPPPSKVPPMIPSKFANQTKRLSDVSEIPEITEHSSNDSMRPSFIKRKLFTQTLDVALEKENEKEDSHSESPLRNIYSSVPRPKNKHGKPVASQPTVKRNLFESVCIRELIEQIVPQEKMNATTGILQKNTQRSSIHEAKSNTTKNKAALNPNSKLPTNQIHRPRESDYDSDIIGEALLESTLQRPTKMNDEDNEKTTTNMKNTVQQKENTKINNNKGKDIKNILGKANNNTSEKKIERKSSKNVDEPKIAKKINDVDSPKQLTQKCNNKESRPENVAKKSSSKDLPNKEINIKKRVPGEPQVPKQLNKSGQFRDLVNSMKEKKATSNEGNKPKDFSKLTNATNKEKGTSKPIMVNKMHNVDRQNQNCSTISKNTLNSSRSHKRSASNQREQLGDLANSMKEKKTTSNESNKAKDLSKFTTASNKEKETSKPIVINKVHNDLDRQDQKFSTVNKKNLNSSRGNKRSASNPPNKPSKVMKTQSESKQTKPAIQSTSAPNKGKKHENEQVTSESEDLEISFKIDTLERLHKDTSNNSSRELDIRRSKRKCARPSRYIEECFGVRRSARKIVRPSRFSDFALNTSKVVCRNTSAGNARKSREVINDNRVSPDGRERPRSTSPTYTASDVDFSSPKKALSNRMVAKFKDEERQELRRSPRTNLNSKKKPASPVFKVTKQKISFGRKAKSPITATVQHKPIALPEQTQTQKKARDDAAIDSFLEEDSADDFTEQSLQRSHSFTGSQPKQSTVAHAVKTTAKVTLTRLDLDSTLVTRSASKSAERPRQKVQSPAYNVKKNNIATARKISSGTRNSPRIANRAKVTEHKSAASNRLLEQVKTGGDSFLQSSEDERAGGTKPSDTTKQSIAAASNRLLEQVKTGGDSFLQSSEDERAGVTKPCDTTKQSRAPISKNTPRKSTPRRANNINSTIPKNTNVKANLTSSDNRTSFKQPLPVSKAPARTNSNITANISLRSTLSQSSIRTNRNKSQKLPKKILELLGSEFEEEDSQEEIDTDAGSNTIRQRVDQLKKRKRNRNAPSPTRSELSTRSEMIHPSQSLKNRAARTFNSTQSQYIHGGQGDIRRPRHELGMTSLAIGTNPGYKAMNSTRNTTRFDDNASVASFQSVRSFRSVSGKLYVPTLHF